MQAEWNSITSSKGAISFETLTNIFRMIISKFMEPVQRSLYSGWAAGLTIQVSITGRGKRFSPFPKTSTPAMEPIHPPI